MPGPNGNPAPILLQHPPGRTMLTMGIPNGDCGLDLSSSKYQRVTFERASLMVFGLTVRVQSNAAVSFLPSVWNVLYWRPSTQPPGRNVFVSGTVYMLKARESFEVML